jgi:hypothetical protein
MQRRKINSSGAREGAKTCRLIPVILKIVLGLRLERRGYWLIVSGIQAVEHPVQA